MRLRAQTQAAFRALLDLSLNSAYHAPVPLSDIARRQRLGVAFLEQLFRPLKRVKLVAPWRGMKGGYTLARPAEEVTPLELMRALDDPCVRPHAARGKAEDAEGRALAAVVAEVETAIDASLGVLTLADLKKRAQAEPTLKGSPRPGSGFQI